MKNTMRLLYNSTPPHLYGHLQIVDQNGTIRSSSPFIISEKIDENKTIIYGSVENLLRKLVNLLEELQIINDNIEKEITKQNLQIETKTDNKGRIIKQLPQGDVAGKIFHKYTMHVEHILLLMGIYSRILFEMVPKTGKSKIQVYGYDNEILGQVSLNDIANLFCHHRYMFIDGEHIKDLFTDKKYLSPNFMGGKIEWREYVETLKNVAHSFKLRDLTNLLSSRINNISGEMEHGQIVFLVQNMESLTKIMGNKISDNRYNKMLDLYFNDKVNKLIDTCGIKSKVNVKVLFKNPHFQIRSELTRKEIDISVSMDIRIGASPVGTPNLTNHHIYVGYKQFFKKINELFGDDPLVPKAA